MHNLSHSRPLAHQSSSCRCKFVRIREFGTLTIAVLSVPNKSAKRECVKVYLWTFYNVQPAPDEQCQDIVFFFLFFLTCRSLCLQMPAEDSGKMFVCALERGRWACESRAIMRTFALFKRSMPPRRPLQTVCCLHLCSESKGKSKSHVLQGL